MFYFWTKSRIFLPKKFVSQKIFSGTNFVGTNVTGPYIHMPYIHVTCYIKSHFRIPVIFKSLPFRLLSCDFTLSLLFDYFLSPHLKKFVLIL